MSTLYSDIRFSTWNCHGGFRSGNKVVAFARLEADIAVLQEVLKRDLQAFPGAPSQLWIGPNDGKGVAVLGFNGWKIEPAPPSTKKWFLPVVASRGNSRLKVLGLWVKPENGSYRPSTTVEALKSLEDFLSEPATVIIGDFNANISWDVRKNSSPYRFRPQLDQLCQRGFTSVWHHSRDERHGAESVGTRYHEWCEAKPVHIDYAFVSSDLLPSVTNVTLGTFQDWTGAKQSDHVPLSFDLRSERSRNGL